MSWRLVTPHHSGRCHVQFCLLKRACHALPWPLLNISLLIRTWCPGDGVPKKTCSHADTCYLETLGMMEDIWITTMTLSRRWCYTGCNCWKRPLTRVLSFKDSNNAHTDPRHNFHSRYGRTDLLERDYCLGLTCSISEISYCLTGTRAVQGFEHSSDGGVGQLW